MTTTPFHEAVKHIGSLNRMAALIGRRQSTLQIWDKRGWPSPEACPAIERVTDGKFSRFDLLAPAFDDDAAIARDGRRTPKKRRRSKRKAA